MRTTFRSLCEDSLAWDMVSIQRNAFERTAFQRKNTRERQGSERILTFTLTFHPYPHQAKSIRCYVFRAYFFAQKRFAHLQPYPLSKRYYVETFCRNVLRRHGTSTTR